MLLKKCGESQSQSFENKCGDQPHSLADLHWLQELAPSSQAIRVLCMLIEADWYPDCGGVNHLCSDM